MTKPTFRPAVNPPRDPRDMTLSGFLDRAMRSPKNLRNLLDGLEESDLKAVSKAERLRLGKALHRAQDMLYEIETGQPMSTADSYIPVAFAKVIYKHRDNCGCDDPTGAHCEPKSSGAVAKVTFTDGKARQAWRG